MAKITFRGVDEYGKKLAELNAALNRKILEQAVAAGAEPVADQIRANLQALPEDQYRRLKPGETFAGIPAGQKKDLADSFGLTPISVDKNGFINTKAGFDGYGTHPTKKYPQGLPNPLLARAVESGSSVRQKTPFVRPAINKTKKKAVEEMEKVIDSELKKIF